MLAAAAKLLPRRRVQGERRFLVAVVDVDFAFQLRANDLILDFLQQVRLRIRSDGCQVLVHCDASQKVVPRLVSQVHGVDGLQKNAIDFKCDRFVLLLCC